MPIPLRSTRALRCVLNPVMLRLAGRGSLVELEHTGRSSGRTYRTPLLAFRRGDVVTVALTYGPSVQWLANIRAAGSCRMRMRGEVLTLGPPRAVDPELGRRRTTVPARWLLRWPIRCRDYIELDVTPPTKRA